MIRSILMLALIVIMQTSFAQDTTGNKTKQMDRNRITDTVHVSGSNDKMNVYVPPTSDSLQTANSTNNSLRSDSNVIAPPIEAKPKGESVWVSRGLWVALLAIIIAIVARRRRNAGK